MDKENSICRAKIKSNFTGAAKALLIVLLIVCPIAVYLIYVNLVGWCESESLVNAIIAFAIVVVLAIIIHTINKFISSNCSLSLSEKGINGQRKKLFSAAQLNLPIDKVDNIMISESIFDKLRGGKTVAVRSTSGLIKFPWVQNADEFVNATLAKIEEFKQSVKNENKNLVSAIAQNATSNGNNSSAAAKIKELKDLLDNGLISQEEFDAKRKELIDKM